MLNLNALKKSMHPIITQTFKQIKKLATPYFVFALLSLVSAPAFAWNSVTILTTNASPAVLSLIKQFKATLNQTNNQAGQKMIVHIASRENGIALNIPKDTLVLALGTKALAYASNLNEKTPVLGLLVPKFSYEKILQESGRKPKDFSAIYLDQPFERQLAFINTIQPNTTLGVLLGPTSQFQSNALQLAAKKYNIVLKLLVVDKQSQLLSALNKMLSDKVTLLAVPDPLIYNRETAQTILLTAYNHQTPIIGYSQSYTTSGAIGAVFTQPQQLGMQAATLIQSMARLKENNLPPAQYPASFAVDINRQVARSLKVNVQSEHRIVEEMKRNG